MQLAIRAQAIAIAVRCLIALTTTPLLTVTVYAGGKENAELPVISSFAMDMIYFKERRPFSSDDVMEAVDNKDKAIASLNSIVKFIGSDRGIRFGVVGFADEAECDGDECLRLSERRAILIRSWLIENGVSSSILSEYKGRGNLAPVDFSDTERQRVRNRRVEIRAINVYIPERDGEWYE